MILTVQIADIDKLMARLKAVGGGPAKKIIRRALREGAKFVLSAAKSNAPVKTGALRDSLKVRSVRTRRRGQTAIQVATGAGWFKGDQFYGGFIEFGRHAGSRKYKFRSRAVGRERRVGRQRAALVRAGGLSDQRPWIEGTHFITRAVRETGAGAAEIIGSSIARGIEKLAAAGATTATGEE